MWRKASAAVLLALAVGYFYSGSPELPERVLQYFSRASPGNGLEHAISAAWEALITLPSRQWSKVAVGWVTEPRCLVWICRDPIRSLGSSGDRSGLVVPEEWLTGGMSCIWMRRKFRESSLTLPYWAGWPYYRAAKKTMQKHLRRVQECAKKKKNGSLN